MQEPAPAAASPAASSPTGAPAAAAPTEVAGGIEGLRNHPSFDDLRRLVQTNPAALPAVLQQIGQQVSGGQVCRMGAGR